MLDGMDEAVSQEYQEMVDRVPFLTEVPGIRWLMVGRETCTSPYFAIRELMEEKEVGIMELGPLSREEVIGLLAESGAKYELFQSPHREQMVELAIERSEGNPLYLRGLLEDLISGRKQMELSSFEQLPDGMNGFFDEGMEGLGVVGKSQELKALLLTLAWVLFYPDKRVGRNEKTQASGTDVEATQRFRWRSLFRFRSTWGLALGQFGYLYSLLDVLPAEAPVYGQALSGGYEASDGEPQSQ